MIELEQDKLCDANLIGADASILNCLSEVSLQTISLLESGEHIDELVVAHSLSKPTLIGNGGGDLGAQAACGSTIATWMRGCQTASQPMNERSSHRLVVVLRECRAIDERHLLIGQQL